MKKVISITLGGIVFAIEESAYSTLSSYLERIKVAALKNENVFNELMEAVKYCSLGQITEALFEVGGKYRRNL